MKHTKMRSVSRGKSHERALLDSLKTQETKKTERSFECGSFFLIRGAEEFLWDCNFIDCHSVYLTSGGGEALVCSDSGSLVEADINSQRKDQPLPLSLD